MAEKKDVKRYKCMNFGACTKADQGTIIEINALETIGETPACPYCHQHTLEEQIKKPTNWKLIGGIAAAVVVLGGGAALMFTGGGAANEPIQKPLPTEIVDTPQVDSVKVAEEVPVAKPEKEKADVKQTETDNTSPKTSEPKPQPKSYNMGWGVYEGPMSGGKPNGFGGSIIVRSNYSIDLKKASGETVEVSSGDKIMNVKMENGRMRQGEIHFADGTRRFISGL